MEKLFEVVAEDDDFLVINKPAGLVCHPTKGDEYSSLIARVRLYLKETPGPHLINRLDRETSGLVIVAKQLDAAVRLRRLWENREVEKEYIAIAHGEVLPGKTTIRAPLGKDPNSAVSIKDTVVEGGAKAETHIYRLRTFLREGRPLSVVRISLMTGRKHQIRIHLSHIGHPIVGDKLYGGDENMYLAFVKEELSPSQWKKLITRNHALHAARISFTWFGTFRTYGCKPESWFNEIAGTVKEESDAPWRGAAAN